MVMILIHGVFVHIMAELGLVFEKLLKLLGGFFVCHKPVLLTRQERRLGAFQTGPVANYNLQPATLQFIEDK